MDSDKDGLTAFKDLTGNDLLVVKTDVPLSASFLERIHKVIGGKAKILCVANGTKIERRTNPLKEIISDDEYEKLLAGDYINEISVRDKIAREKFRKLRSENKDMKSDEVIEKLRNEDYPHLQFETVKKMCHNYHRKKKGKII